MPDRLELASEVFVVFRLHYEQNRPDAVWGLSFREQSPVPGLSLDEAREGAGVLLQKGLIRHMGTGRNYRLTDRGKEACLHPEQLDQYFAPLFRSGAPQAVTINAANMHNTQVGHGNTQHITYSVVLNELRRKIEDADIPPAEKSKLVQAIQAVAAHPLTQTILGGLAGLGAAAASK